MPQHALGARHETEVALVITDVSVVVVLVARFAVRRAVALQQVSVLAVDFEGEEARVWRGCAETRCWTEPLNVACKRRTSTRTYTCIRIRKKST